MNLSLNQIQNIYSRIKKHAFAEYSKQNLDKTIDSIDKAAYFAQLFNWIYKDDELEQLMLHISKTLINQISINESSNTQLNKRIVFYDEIGSSVCLSVQYLRALMALKYDILYIFESSSHKCSNQIITELNSYSMSRIVLIDSSRSNKIEKIQSLYDIIVDFGARQSLLHTPAGGAFGVILWNALMSIKRYRIVPGDHHFYLGISCTDIFLEFRRFGCTIDIEKRGVKKEQIVVNPYYPLFTNKVFTGFPISIESKTVIFASSNYYKIYGEGNFFFKMLTDLLCLNSSVVIMFAGDGFDVPFRKFIEVNGFEDRIYLLGYRTDLSLCIAHADIFMATFPFAGGLTTQIAAFQSKPILSFTTNQLNNNIIDDLLTENIDEKFTIKEYDKYIEYAKKLINDVEFRKVEGNRAKSCLTTEYQFTKKLNLILQDQGNKTEVNFIDVDYNKRIQLYLNIENQYIARARWIVFDNFVRNGINGGGFILFSSFFSSLFCSYFWNRIRTKTIKKLSSFISH